MLPLSWFLLVSSLLLRPLQFGNEGVGHANCYFHDGRLRLKGWIGQHTLYRRNCRPLPEFDAGHAFGWSRLGWWLCRFDLVGHEGGTKHYTNLSVNCQISRFQIEAQFFNVGHRFLSDRE